jgi:mono/diheme cytochrome c family protein
MYRHATLLLLALAQASGEDALRLRVGDPASLAVPESARSGGAGVLVVVGGSRTPAPQEDLKTLRSRGWAFLHAVSPAQMAAFVNAPPKSPVVFLLDSERVVRRIADAAGAGRLLELAGQYEAGRQGYQTACARCHGDDGASESYPNIKTLRGAGVRMTEAEIRARIHPVPLAADQFAVRSQIFTGRQLDALVAYVAGL